jgi:hypothetical protein
VSALLLACTAATLLLTGIAAFVQVVHYPLFASVGEPQFTSYHEAHSRLTTRVVIVPMVIELITAWLLLLEPPADEGALTILGALLASATWALTVLVAVPAHRQLSTGLRPRALRRLLRANLVRSLTWAGHSAVCLALIALTA